VNELNALLKGLGAAATNPLALVAYIVAVISWAFLRARVERNKNLLQKLKDLPEQDRVKILREEMGTAPLNAGLTPEQWIEAQVHKYYFWCFLIICGVVVMLFAISAYVKGHTEVVPEVRLILPPQEDPNVALMKGVEEIDLGVQQDFVIAKLGPPREARKSNKDICAYYDFSFAKVQFWFDDAKNLVFKYVVATTDKYRPDFFSAYLDLQDRQGCLGCFTFRDVSRSPGAAPTPDNPHPMPSNKPEDDGVPPVVYYNLPASGGVAAKYVERFQPANGWHREVFLVSTSDGVDVNDEHVEGEIFNFMDKWNDDSAFYDYFGKLPVDEQRRFIELRGKYKPNGYALVADPPEDSSMQEIPFDGHIGSVSCVN
jgi:hypothetical protein